MKNMLKELLITNDVLIIDEILHHPPYDIAKAIQNFAIDDQITVFNIMPIDKSIQIFRYIKPNKKCEVLIKLSVGKARILINSQPIDDLVQLFRESNPNQKKN